MKNLVRTLLSAFFVGVSLSVAILVVTLLSMLERYSKDLNEVIACWQYVTAAVVIAILAGTFAVHIYRNS